MRIATRGSDLALWQANHVADRLRRQDSGEITVRSISTRGDREVEPLRDIGGTGLFTAEIDRALLEGDADLAVHSLKDLPVETPEGLTLTAILTRGPVEDVLVTTDGATLAELPRGARIGTSSPRRASFLRSVRSDLEIVDLRGNVPTRVERVRAGELAGTILARAGLERLDLSDGLGEILGPPRLLPAPGQGAVAVTARADDEAAQRLASRINDPPTRTAVEAERAVLEGLGGGCSLPLGVLVCPDGGGWQLASVLFLEDGATRLDDSRAGDDPLRLAAESAEALRRMGALT
jgi:hydroxymethylbilane synthase